MMRVLVLAVVSAVAAVTTISAQEAPRSLGGFPVCEASAAALVPCPESDGTCLLVGDNEIRNELFVYQLDGDRVITESRKPVRFDHLLPGEPDDQEISDIEALVGLPDGEVLIYGSHSRNSACETRGKRRRYLHASLDNGELVEGSRPLVSSKKHSCKRLLGDKRDDLDGTMRQVCDVLERAEEAADEVEDLPEDEQASACSAAAPFNLEGAVAVPDDDGARVWVGLRAPLVDGKAVLLRQKRKRKEFEFNAAALLDLDGFGVRDMTFADGFVWGIGGPSVDADDAHVLWRVEAGSLQDGAELTPELLGSLPRYAEAIVIHDGWLIALMDGAEPEDGSEICKEDSTYIAMPVPG
ncbi:MAG: DUF3616 domain-containing protein [Pseudomonadota bacterium]